MGELIKVARLGEMPPGTCRHVDAGGQAVAVFNVDGTIHAIGGKPIGAVLWEKARWTGQWSLVHGTVLSSM